MQDTEQLRTVTVVITFDLIGLNFFSTIHCRNNQPDGRTVAIGEEAQLDCIYVLKSTQCS